MASTVSGLYLVGSLRYPIVKIGQSDNVQRRLKSHVRNLRGGGFPEVNLGLSDLERSLMADSMVLMGFTPVEKSLLTAFERVVIQSAVLNFPKVGKSKEWFDITGKTHSDAQSIFGLDVPPAWLEDYFEQVI